MKIGNDIVLLSRMKKFYTKFGVCGKVFTEQEQKHIRSLTNEDRIIQTMAGYWGAKESVAKALGYGFSNGVIYTDIEVIKDNRNKPTIVLYGKSKELFEKDFHEIDVSIAHDGDYAFCVCVLN